MLRNGSVERTSVVYLDNNLYPFLWSTLLSPLNYCAFLQSFQVLLIPCRLMYISIISVSRYFTFRILPPSKSLRTLDFKSGNVVTQTAIWVMFGLWLNYSLCYSFIFCHFISIVFGQIILRWYAENKGIYRNEVLKHHNCKASGLSPLLGIM